VRGGLLWEEPLLEVSLVRHPNVTPQCAVVTTQFGIPGQSSFRCCGEIKVHPDPIIQTVKYLWME
jgi:hypothetical protein